MGPAQSESYYNRMNRIGVVKKKNTYELYLIIHLTFIFILILMHIH